MTDIVDKHTRSRMMSGIRSKNTKPEVQLRKILHNAGFRYRLHTRALPGCPDIVLPRYKAVIFVNGCFWHRHEGCPYASTPSSNTVFWNQKFLKTLDVDKKNIETLKAQGWRIAVVWECELRKTDSRQNVADNIIGWLKSGQV